MVKDSVVKISESAQTFINSAKTQPKGDYRIYSSLMRQLESLPLKNGEFERTQRELINVLEI